jgi:hypothetical protein
MPATILQQIQRGKHMRAAPIAYTATSQVVIVEARDTNERISLASVSSWALYDFANTKFQLL